MTTNNTHRIGNTTYELRYVEGTGTCLVPVERKVHLQGIGDVPGTPAGDLKVGDVLVWNYGYRYRVESVEQVSPKFVAIVERPEHHDGTPGTKTYTRRLKIDRLVAVAK